MNAYDTTRLTDLCVCVSVCVCASVQVLHTNTPQTLNGVQVWNQMCAFM